MGNAFDEMSMMPFEALLVHLARGTLFTFCRCAFREIDRFVFVPAGTCFRTTDPLF
jgi:hypothetical protein